MTALPEAVSRLVAEIRRVPGVRRVLLFGSRARGDARERSDVDLAVEGPDISERDWLAMLEAAERAETLLRIDLIRLEEAPVALRERVRVEGLALL
jgi:predicted nucleotidyltransferase